MSTRVLDALKPPKLKTALGEDHVVVVTDDEEVQIRDAQGSVKVTIALTDGAPTVRLSGARLELEGTEAVAVKTKVFEVRAADKVDVQSEGTVEVASRKGMTLLSDEDFVTRAPTIWLN